MNLCRDCDQEVTYITVKGIARPIHESGHCGEYRKTARPAKCPKCAQRVYFVEHNGGSVWFDEPLGPPWPKHPCFDLEANSEQGAGASRQFTLGYFRPPKKVSVPLSTDLLKQPPFQRSDFSRKRKKGNPHSKLPAIAVKSKVHAARLKNDHEQTVRNAAPTTQSDAVRSEKPKKVPPATKPRIANSGPEWASARSPVRPVPARPIEVSMTLAGNHVALWKGPIRPLEPACPDARKAKITSPLNTVARPDSARTSTVAVVLDKQGRRRCEFCNAMVKPTNYGRHKVKEHSGSQL